MVKKVQTLLLLLMLVCAGRSAAQVQFVLLYDSLNFPSPSTVSQGDSVFYPFTIKNVSANTFSDTLKFNIRTSQGTFLLSDLRSQTILPSDSINLVLGDSVTAQRYGGGVSIVVIWPTAPQTTLITDSISTLLTVLFTGVEHGKASDFQLSVFPNPTSDQITLIARSGLAAIRETVVYDGAGRIVSQTKGLAKQIDLSDQPKGIYCMRIFAENGAVASFKVVKQ